MKKKKNGNLGVMIIAIIMIVLALVGAYLLKEKKVSENPTSGENNNITLNETEEKEVLNQTLKEMEASLGFLAVLTSIDKYNAGGDYITKKNVNLLKDTKSKQLFVMEQIVKNTENDKNFVILNMNGEVDTEENIPTTDGTTAYYPTDLFKKEYAKYFKETFSLEERQVSTFNNTYDKDTNYIYYENRRAGANGLSVTGITIEKIEVLSSSKYQASITLNYSDRLATMLGVDSESAKLVYQRNEDNIQIDSYMIK